MNSYFTAYFKTTYKIHLARDKIETSNHNYYKNKITNKCIVKKFLSSKEIFPKK